MKYKFEIECTDEEQDVLEFYVRARDISHALGAILTFIPEGELKDRAEKVLKDLDLETLF